VVPVLIIAFTLTAKIWYFIHRRRRIQKEKRKAREESAMMMEKARQRQRRRDRLREQGSKDNKDVRDATDVAGWGLPSNTG
jgi:hypothetical protein